MTVTTNYVPVAMGKQGQLQACRLLRHPSYMNVPARTCSHTHLGQAVLLGGLAPSEMPQLSLPTLHGKQKSPGIPSVKRSYWAGKERIAVPQVPLGRALCKPSDQEEGNYFGGKEEMEGMGYSCCRALPQGSPTNTGCDSTSYSPPHSCLG